MVESIVLAVVKTRVRENRHYVFIGPLTNLKQKKENLLMG